MRARVIGDHRKDPHLLALGTDYLLLKRISPRSPHSKISFLPFPEILKVGRRGEKLSPFRDRRLRSAEEKE